MTPSRPRPIIALAAALCLGTLPLRADDLAQPDTQSLTAIIDQSVSTKLAEAGITPAPGIDDTHFLRRVTLDLAGRIPTPSEQAAFLADETPSKRARLIDALRRVDFSDGILDEAPDKRARLVDRLLASPDAAFHERNELNRLLMGPRSVADTWNNYLLTAAREHRSWDRLFREILLPERELPPDSGAAEFLRQRAQGIDTITNDVAVLLFGVNVSCAKCHDHPLVPDWKQDHYFGLASFFQRTYPTQRGLVAEKFDGRLKFTTVAGEEKQAAFLFLSGTAVDEPPLTWTDDTRKTTEEAVSKAEKEAEAPPPPLPEFSPRASLVRLALDQGEQGFLARNYVNRLWARLIGRGLVHPLDQMHSGNPPSHPDLLAALAGDFVQHGYDSQRLVRAIVLSEAYARDSRWTTGDRPPPELFAVANVRPLTPRQVALSLDVATLAPAQINTATTGDGWPAQREQLESRAAGLASRLELPEDGFQVSVDEALLFSNGTAVADDYLKTADDRLIGALASASPADAISSIFASVLARVPSDEERNAIASYLAQRSDRPTDGLKQVVWALLASPEFRFNH